MAITFQTNPVGAYGSSIGSIGGTNQTINNNFNPTSIELTPERISIRTTSFIEQLEKKIFNQTETLDVKALKGVIKLVSEEGVEPLKGALWKNGSYFARLFSGESWQEWLDNRTPLGRVVSKYCDYVTSSTRKSGIKQLDIKLFEIANRDAKAILDAIQTENDSPLEPEEVAPRSFWSTFLSLPVAEAQHLAPRTFPANFELSSLNGNNGFILNGINSKDSSGASVASAGDVNGDGISDLIVGGPGASSHAGQSYVVFGHKGNWWSPFNFSSLNGNNGFILNGINSQDNSGGSVASAGDVNGDGIGDIIVGAPFASSFAGQSYVVFGSRNGWKSPLSLSSLNGTNGFILNGINGGSGKSGDMSGYSVASAGDVNGDGIGDIIVGAYYAGQSYVIFGSKGGWNSPISLSSLNGNNGFILSGINSQDQSGYSVASAGDVNGDGISDLIVGGPGASSRAGQSYVVFGYKGKWTSPFNFSSLNGNNGFILNGINGGDMNGYSVASAGDVNGDGIGDLIVGAPFASSQAGQSYVVFGSRNGWSSPLSLSSLNGNNGFILNGINSQDYSGGSVASAGDVNGDGIGDLVVGAPSALSSAGQSYLVFGSRASWGSPLSFSSLNGNNGFILSGINSGDASGACVASAGDVNGDGIGDLIVGGPGASSGAGQSYVVFGQASK